jgi:hypothetical protein
MGAATLCSSCSPLLKVQKIVMPASLGLAVIVLLFKNVKEFIEKEFEC